MKKILISLLVFFWTCISVQARVTITCKVSYYTNHHESNPELVNVEFLSSKEFGKYNEGNMMYEIIWFTNNQCAVVRMEDSLMGTDDVVTYDSMLKYFCHTVANICSDDNFRKQINTDRDVYWKIKVFNTEGLDSLYYDSKLEQLYRERR